MYSQTTANSISDLIDTIQSFAATAGWTVHRNNTVSGVRVATLRKSGDYIHLYNTSADGIIRIRASVGYSALDTPDNQPDVSLTAQLTNTGDGPYPTVYLFADDSPAEALYVVIEKSAGIYRHIAFGELEKLGAYTGGTFYAGTYVRPVAFAVDEPWGVWNKFPFSTFQTSTDGSYGGVRCDVDGQTNYFAPMAPGSLYATPTVSGITIARSRTAFYERSISSWSNVTPLQPIKIRIERASDFWSDIGVVPNCRFLNMARLQPAEEFAIGPDTWKVFPLWRQGFVDGEEYSEDVALAYRKT